MSTSVFKFQVQPSYEPAVVERYRFETRVHGLERVEASSLAHVQQYSVSMTTETTQTLASKTEIEWHMMREENGVESATATETTHEDHEVTIVSVNITGLFLQPAYRRGMRDHDQHNNVSERMQ